MVWFLCDRITFLLSKEKSASLKENSCYGTHKKGLISQVFCITTERHALGKILPLGMSGDTEWSEHVEAIKRQSAEACSFTWLEGMTKFLIHFMSLHRVCVVVYMVCIWQYEYWVCVFVGRRVGHRGFCKKLLEASSTSDRAKASQLQDGPTDGQDWVKQIQWQHLWDNADKEGKG